MPPFLFQIIFKESLQLIPGNIVSFSAVVKIAVGFVELFWIVFIAEFFIAKLFAGQIKNAVADNIVAVVVAALTQDAVNFSAKNILDKKNCEKMKFRYLTTLV